MYRSALPSGEHQAAQHILCLLIGTRSRAGLCVEAQELFGKRLDVIGGTLRCQP